MGSYSLLEEVWDKPLVENQDLLVNQRGSTYEGPISQTFSNSPVQSYSNIPQYKLQSADQRMAQSQTFPPNYSAPQSAQVSPQIATAAPTSNNVYRTQNKPPQIIFDGDNSSSETTKYTDDARYVSRIRALEEQISRLESSFGAKQSSTVSDMMSNNDLLMYIATGAFFIFVMDNIAKMSKRH